MNVYVYHTSPNQKTIIPKKAISDREHTYSILNLDATMNAARVLSDRAFKLYVRMDLHQNGHTYALSPIEIQNSTGMTDKRYRGAVNELIEKGFLVRDGEHTGLYYFLEAPAQIEQDRADAPTKTEVSSGENGRMILPNQTGNPAILGGEIVHNITSHITSDNTNDNSIVAGNFYSFQNALNSFGKPGFFDELGDDNDDTLQILRPLIGCCFLTRLIARHSTNGNKSKSRIRWRSLTQSLNQ